MELFCTMRPLPLAAHERDDATGQVVPAEQVGFELGAQDVAAQILDRARLTIGAVVEQRVEPSAGQLQRAFQCRADARRIVQIQSHRAQSLRFESGDVLGPTRRSDHLPAAPRQFMRAVVADAAGAAGDEDGTEAGGCVRVHLRI
jgi:hypothetical protein